VAKFTDTLAARKLISAAKNSPAEDLGFKMAMPFQSRIHVLRIRSPRINFSAAEGTFSSIFAAEIPAAEYFANAYSYNDRNSNFLNLNEPHDAVTTQA